MDDSAHGPHKDTCHEEISRELQLHFGKKYPLEAEIKTFAVHQIFEGLDVLDAISTVKNLGYLIE